MQKRDYERFTWSMTTLVSFPSVYIRVEVKYILLLADQKCLRTVNDHRDLVVDAGHLIVDVEYLILDTSHSIIDSMRGIQNLIHIVCHLLNGYPCLFSL